MSESPPITLRQLSADDLPTLQDLFERSQGYFVRYAGGPARPEMAALIYTDVLRADDRVLVGVWWQREMLIGCLDVRFHHPAPDVLWFGALILADELPLPREELAGWALRIFEAWLGLGTSMCEVRTAVAASDREAIRFWHDQDYEPQPEALRRLVAGKQQRFVIFRKELVRQAKAGAHG